MKLKNKKNTSSKKLIYTLHFFGVFPLYNTVVLQQQYRRKRYDINSLWYIRLDMSIFLDTHCMKTFIPVESKEMVLKDEPHS